MADVSTIPVTSGAWPQLAVHPMTDKGRYGTFAAFVLIGNVITTWGGGVTVGADLTPLPKSSRIHSIQVEDNLFLKPADGSPVELADPMNPSRELYCHCIGRYAGRFSPYLPRPVTWLKDQEQFVKRDWASNGRRQPNKAMS